jgi:hypothetical protein
MPRDTRTQRDLHALDGEGMVLCNPRDREAAHRAEHEGIATDDQSAVTCPACLSILHRIAREERVATDETNAPSESDKPAAAAEGFKRIRDAANMVGSVREGDGVDPRLAQLRRLNVGSQRKVDHGAERLGQQIFDCLRLSTVLSEAGLDQFAFVGVLPGGRGGHYLVEVACLDPTATYDVDAVQQVLAAQRPRLRAEISHGVHRRKAPEVSFLVKPPGFRIG